jgi:3-methyl-2-oxobutanoate hydroxymethyltransferase
LDEACVDVILVGDSVGNVRLGYPDTTYVTMEDMEKTVSSVAKANPKALVVGDMPIHSFDTACDAVKNARRLITAGAEAVKIEGGKEVKGVVGEIRAAEIEVMGHIAHTPQTDRKHLIEGKTEEQAEELICDASSLEEAGVFSMVLELVDREVAKRITDLVSIPTIGIGAGPDTDGQVLVLDDLVGWTDFSKFPKGKSPKFVGEGWDRRTPKAAVKQYIHRVKNRMFPTEKESYRVYRQ